MALPIHLFRNFCCRMYPVLFSQATIHFITYRDRWTDRQYHANSQYDRLMKTVTECVVILLYRAELDTNNELAL